MEDGDVDEIELARRIRRKPGYVRNLLEEPSTMSLADLSDVLFALGWRVDSLVIESAGRRARPLDANS